MHAQKPKRHVDVSQLGLDELLAADLLADKNESEPANSSDSPDGSDEETSSGSEGLEFDQADIERLKDQDPDFYKYLKDTDEGLLEFRDDDDDDDEELVDGEPEADQDGGQEHGAGSHSSEDGSDRDLDGKAATHGSSPEGATITSESLKSWCRVAQNNASIGAVRQVTRLYRVACHFGDEDEDQDESMKLASSAVYNNILLFMLGKADGIFRKALGMAGGVASGSQREDGDDGDDERTAGHVAIGRSHQAREVLEICAVHPQLSGKHPPPARQGDGSFHAGVHFKAAPPLRALPERFRQDPKEVYRRIPQNFLLG
jgi:hypothetical protein